MKMRNELAVSQSPRARRVLRKPSLEQRPHFIEESARQLAVESRGDALRERGTRPPKPEEERGERLRRPLAAERADRTPRELMDLERADDPDRIAGKNRLERLGIHPAQLLAQGFQPVVKAGFYGAERDVRCHSNFV